MFKIKSVRLIGLFLIGACVAAFGVVTPGQAGFTRHLLLETDAAYQLQFSFPNRMDSSPPILSIYTYTDEEEPLLNVTRLYRGLPGEEVTQAKLVFKSPSGSLRALIRVQSDLELNDNLSIERIDSGDSSLPDEEIASLIVNHQLYTGLIVDARGLDVQRGISPQIWSESGDLIYGGVAAPYEFIQNKGVISYGHSVSPDLIKRVSIPGKLSYTAPLTVDAKDVIGKTQTSVVITEECANTILHAIQNYDFLARYAVIMLVD